MSSTRRSETGFTLIEALIAMVILSFGLIAVTNLLLVAATSNTSANQSTAATTVATQRLEALKALRFADPGLAAGGDIDTDAAGYNADVPVTGVGVVHARWEIHDVDATTKYIIVRAEGSGVAGARSRAEFTTIRVLNP